MGIRHRNREKGQATIEFLGVIPIAMLAIVLIAYAGVQVYLKASSQNFAYTQCLWAARQHRMDSFPAGIEAYNYAYDATKRWWSDEVASSSNSSAGNYTRTEGALVCGAILSGTEEGSPIQSLSGIGSSGVRAYSFMFYSPFISCGESPTSCK